MVRREQDAYRATRPRLRSPGRPKFQRQVEVAYWEQIAKGQLAEKAAAVVGVAQAVGARWLHKAGGMPQFDVARKPPGRHRSLTEREETARLTVQG